MKKPISCTQCASKFANPADLEINENQDQNEKTFCCSSFDFCIFVLVVIHCR